MYNGGLAATSDAATTALDDAGIEEKDLQRSGTTYGEWVVSWSSRVVYGRNISRKDMIIAGSTRCSERRGGSII